MTIRQFIMSVFGQRRPAVAAPSTPRGFGQTPPSLPVGNAFSTTTYPVGAVNLADAMYLYRMDYYYRHALAQLPGAHQLAFDILVDSSGRRWSDGVPQPAGTVNDPGLKADINRLINLAGSDNAALTQQFDVATYIGPCRQVYANLVAAKLAKVV